MRNYLQLLPIRVILAISAPAMGALPGEVSGQSAKYHVRFEDPRETADAQIFFAAFDPEDGGGAGGYPLESKPVPFKQECTLTTKRIVCRANGSTPLAGTTYRRTEDATPTCPGNDREYRFTCVKGCKHGAPRYLRVEPYEC